MTQSKNKDLLLALVESIQKSKKYASLGIPRETLQDIVALELRKFSDAKKAEKSIRHKLHNMVAPYLGDPDYAAEAEKMDWVFSQGTFEEKSLYCTSILMAHASTRERIPILAEFYKGIFGHTGQPQIILDLACGLNPFSIPWMALPAGIKYYAYDIHRPRIGLINQFLEKQKMPPLAECRDILLNPPEIEADIVFIFKEAHRMEQRRRGCNLALWKSLKVKHLLVSLPASSLSGQHDLVERQRHLVHTIVGNEPWKIHEMLFGNEMVFCIEKTS